MSLRLSVNLSATFLYLSLSYCEWIVLSYKLAWLFCHINWHDCAVVQTGMNVHELYWLFLIKMELYLEIFLSSDWGLLFLAQRFPRGQTTLQITSRAFGSNLLSAISLSLQKLFRFIWHLYYLVGYAIQSHTGTAWKSHDLLRASRLDDLDAIHWA